MRLLLLPFVLALCGCTLDQEAAVIAVDRGWSVEVAASDKDGFASPDGLLWSNGRLLVADEGGSALRSWSPGSRPTTLADRSSGLASPEDLAVDAQGNVFFSDDTRGGVWMTDAAGRTRALARPDQGLPSTEGLAITPEGELLAGDGPGHRVMKVSRDGRVSVFLGPERGIRKPESFAYDPAGNLYIADNSTDTLYLLTRNGGLHRVISGREGFSPESIRFAGGALLITDSHHGKLFRYTPEDGLSVILLFGGSLANVQGIAADDRGNLFVSVQSDLKAGKGYILRLYRKGRSA
jgi:sugar lactone lactonase YvrE